MVPTLFVDDAIQHAGPGAWFKARIVTFCCPVAASEDQAVPVGCPLLTWGRSACGASLGVAITVASRILPLRRM